MKNFPSDKAKAGQILVNAFKKSVSCFFELNVLTNEHIRNNKFTDSLKLPDITAVYKKFEPCDEANYRQSMLSHYILLKVFEKIIYKQLYEYMEIYMSELLCGFRKALSTQHALFRLLQ